MRALTVQQPWAELIASGAKRIETRRWPAPPKIHGERIAIHAAKKAPKPHAAIGHAMNLVGVSDPSTLPLGVVVATVRVAGCVSSGAVSEVDADDWARMDPSIDGIDPNHESWAWEVVPDRPNDPDAFAVCSSIEGLVGDLSDGRYAWLLENVERLETPIPAKGAQRLWFWHEPAETIAPFLHVSGRRFDDA